MTYVTAGGRLKESYPPDWSSDSRALRSVTVNGAAVDLKHSFGLKAREVSRG